MVQALPSSRWGRGESDAHRGNCSAIARASVAGALMVAAVACSFVIKGAFENSEMPINAMIAMSKAIAMNLFMLSSVRGMAVRAP